MLSGTTALANGSARGLACCTQNDVRRFPESDFDYPKRSEFALWYSVPKPVQMKSERAGTLGGAHSQAVHSSIFGVSIFIQTGEIWWISETLETRSVSAKLLEISQ